MEELFSHELNAPWYGHDYLYPQNFLTFKRNQLGEIAVSSTQVPLLTKFMRCCEVFDKVRYQYQPIKRLPESLVPDLQLFCPIHPPLRIDAMETFLTKHPKYVGKVVLLQVLIPSREAVEGYRHLHHQINERVSRINGKFGLCFQIRPQLIVRLTIFTGDVEYSPIQSQFSSVSKDELTALYAASDACIISSTRDGFNVVSLKYIACQQDRRGVLLLSEFAGAAEVLDDCIKFNPWDTNEFSEAVFQALTMGEDEKRLRFDKLHSFVMRNTR